MRKRGMIAINIYLDFDNYISKWFSLTKNSKCLVDRGLPCDGQERFRYWFGVQNGIESVFDRNVQLMLALQEGVSPGSGSGGLRLRTLSVTTRSPCATRATHGIMP